MKIERSTTKDIEKIFDLYQLAVEFQKVKKCVVWPDFKRELVENEINEGRQFKLLIDDEIACVWAITFSDPQIWEEKDQNDSIFIHRIATNPEFRGKNFVKLIFDWAITYANTLQKKYIRLDTVGENLGLIKHYTNCGAQFLGLKQLSNTHSLPAHYHNAKVSLFEIAI